MNRGIGIMSLTAVILALSARPGFSQGFVEHMEPPVLERGKTTRVIIVGSKLGKGLDLWSTLSGAIRAMPVATNATAPLPQGERGVRLDRAEFDVTVANDAPIGVFGLRLATADGLTNAFLALVDDLPVEPVDVPNRRVTLPCAIWGRFREATVDRFLIDVKAGQRVSFEAVANRFGKDVDPLITIRDAKDRFVAERDNDAGLYFDCRFEHTFAEAGTYTVAMRDARFHGSEHGFYVLRMGTFPAATVAVPAAVKPGRTRLLLPELGDTSVEVDIAAHAANLHYAVLKRPGDNGSSWVPLEAGEREATVFQGVPNSFEQGTHAPAPGVLCGVLARPGERHFFRLDLAKAQRITVRAEGRAFNSPADIELAIIDAKGKETRRVTENVQKEEVAFDFTAGAPGIYGLAVRDLNREGGSSFVYRVDVRNTLPEVQVSADVEGLTVPQGNQQPVPLTVARTNYTGKIALSLVGAPAGVSLSPSEIPADANTIVCMLSAAAGAPLGVHTLQIMARPVDSPDALPSLVRCRPMIDKQIVNVDLIPYGLREDQRRLPPALTDRFALQVTPPAPYDVQLAEEQVTLGRYQHVEFAIVITREKGFTGPVTFSAKGGQIAPKEEGRTRVYAEFPTAMPDQPRVLGSIHSKILTNPAKHRVDLTAASVHQGRQVTLQRTFNLEVRSAFAVSVDPPTQKLDPGASGKVRLNVDRLKTFDGEVEVDITPTFGIEMPERIVIPRGQAGVDVGFRVASERAAGKVNINLSATAQVNGYEEENRGIRIEIDVQKAKK